MAIRNFSSIAFLLCGAVAATSNASPLRERLAAAESYLHELQAFLENPAPELSYEAVVRGRQRLDQARTILDELIDEPSLDSAQARGLADLNYFDIPTASTMIDAATRMLDRYNAIILEGTNLSVMREITELNREIGRAGSTLVSLKRQISSLLAASQDQLFPIFQELTGLTTRMLRIRSLLVKLNYAPLQDMLFAKENFCILMADFQNTKRVLKEARQILDPVHTPAVVRPTPQRPVPTAADAARMDNETHRPAPAESTIETTELFGILLPFFLHASWQ